MPTYQYACTACEHRFEAVQSFSDDSLTECAVCQGPLRKVFSSVGIVFKGSGFYRTDSRSGSGAVDGARKETSPNGKKETAAASSGSSSGSGDSGSSSSGSTSSSAPAAAS
ncbi:FmdB family zinc ribbon protein [Pseudonocardia sp. H11422]|uniref:FmdB family zinc ribbon protein n=1 Tax=Pseudonocardia sp. H11422 TaxID=2835866 RepID=UPI001BDD61FF|nr:FmdB family zinc ribbon protein [Pseudonocardia sp. H11422]